MMILFWILSLIVVFLLGMATQISNIRNANMILIGRVSKITYDASLTKDILEILGYTVDAEGYVCKDSNRVNARDGRLILLSDVGGITKKGVVRNSILSLLDIADELDPKEVK